MSIKCPNYNSDEWKKLLAKHKGDKAAALLEWDGIENVLSFNSQTLYSIGGLSGREIRDLYMELPSGGKKNILSELLFTKQKLMRSFKGQAESDKVRMRNAIIQLDNIIRDMLQNDSFNVLLNNGNTVLDTIQDSLLKQIGKATNKDYKMTSEDFTYQLMLSNILSSFTHMKSQLYDEYRNKPEFIKIETIANKADNINQMYLRAIRLSMLSYLQQNYETENTSYQMFDLLQMEEDSSIKSNVLDLGFSNDKFIRVLDKVFKDANYDAENEFLNVIVNPLEKWEKRFKEAGLDIDKVGDLIMENGELVHDIDNNFYREMYSFKNNTKKENKALSDYYRFMRDNIISVSYVDLFTGTDEKKQDARNSILRQFIEGGFNEKEAESKTEQYIKIAQEKFNQLKKDFKDRKENINEFIEEYKNRTDKTKSAKYISDAFLKYNFPDYFVKNMNTIGKQNNVSTKYYHVVPKKRKHYNAKFADFKENNPLVAEFYDWYKLKILDLKRNLPYYSTKESSYYFGFHVPKDYYEDLAKSGMVVRGGKLMMREIMDLITLDNAVNFQEDNKDFINPVEGKKEPHIPIKFTFDRVAELRNKQKQVAKNEGFTEAEKEKANAEIEKEIANVIQSRSTNVKKILMLAGAMSINYKHKSKIEGIVHIAKQIVDEATTIKRNSSGEKIRGFMSNFHYEKDGNSALKTALEYHINSSLYGIKKAVEIGLGIKRLKSDDEEGKELKKELRELKKRYDTSVDDTEKEELDNRITELNVKLDERKGEVTLSNVVDWLIKLTRAKSMALNPFSAIAQYTFGFVSLFTHGGANQDFSNKNVLDAFGILIKSVQDADLREKLKYINKYFNIDGDLTQLGFKADPYFMMKFADKNIRMMTAIATLLKENEFDNFTSENYNGSNKNLRNKISAINSLLHGSSSNNVPINSKWWGRLVTQFRLSWIPLSIESRWGSEKEDLNLGRITKGRYLSYGTLIKEHGFIPALQGILKGLLGQDMGLQMKDVDYRNMRKNVYELYALITLFATIALLKHFVDDEDDENETVSEAALNMFINQINRVQSDILFYVSPMEFKSIIKDPIPAMRTIEDIWDLKNVIGNYIGAKTSDDKTKLKRYDEWYLTRNIAQAFPITTILPKAENMTEELYNK